MIARLSVAFVAAIAAAPSANLRADEALPHYARVAPCRGTIRICGDTQGGLVGLLEGAFIKLNPNIGFSNIQAPSELAVPGMILRIADLGFAGAPAEPSQLYLLSKVGPRRPVEISIAGGSFDITGRSAVLAI